MFIISKLGTWVFSPHRSLNDVASHYKSSVDFIQAEDTSSLNSRKFIHKIADPAMTANPETCTFVATTSARCLSKREDGTQCDHSRSKPAHLLDNLRTCKNEPFSLATVPQLGIREIFSASFENCLFLKHHLQQTC